MDLYSFIDLGLQDFLRDENDNVIKIHFTCIESAEEWLLKNGESYGWTNKGITYWNWDEQ